MKLAISSIGARPMTATGGAGSEARAVGSTPGVRPETIVLQQS